MLETDFETADGVGPADRLHAAAAAHPRIVRVVEGLRGAVPMTIRMRPAVRLRQDQAVGAHGSGDVTRRRGPDALSLRADVPLSHGSVAPDAEFTVRAGDRAGFVLTLVSRPGRTRREPIDAVAPSTETDAWWREWSGRSTYAGGWADEVERSLITLKALTYAPTGGIVAAATTSLPEFLGGVRNWDYRFCWLRDAALTLDALMAAGYVEEATAWRDWVLRAVAGDPEDLQIMYGLGGERRLDEYELAGCRGTRGRPRCGSATRPPVSCSSTCMASWSTRLPGAPARHGSRRRSAETLRAGLVRWLEEHWREPDDGIWEVRGGRQQFVHSKVMAWVAARPHGEDGRKSRAWRTGRSGCGGCADEIHEEVCREGLRRRAEHLHPVLRLDAARRRRCC